MATVPRLAEFESCTLGVILSLQPCSTYAVRRVFARSPTWEWSSSAGSVYPVIRRLLRLKLIRARTQKGDLRGRRDLTVTENGVRAIRSWIRGMGVANATPTPDPVRTRAYFLEALGSAKERVAFLDRAEELTQHHLRQLRSCARTERETSEPDYRATVGACFELEARLRWLRAVRKRIAPA